MPLWAIHTTGAIFSEQEKQTLANSITKIYTAAGLPPFYVRVRFTEHAVGTTFSGAEKDTNFVHLQIWHLARTFTGPEHKKAFLKKADAVLNPVMEGKGVDWEYTIDESPRDLWKINGLVPPPAGSEMEKEWVRENRPIEEREKL